MSFKGLMTINIYLIKYSSLGGIFYSLLSYFEHRNNENEFRFRGSSQSCGVAKHPKVGEDFLIECQSYLGTDSKVFIICASTDSGH